MTDPGLTGYLILSAFLFGCGVLCLATKRNAIGLLMGVELILNAANLNLVAAARYVPALKLDAQVDASYTGHYLRPLLAARQLAADVPALQKAS